MYQVKSKHASFSSSLPKWTLIGDGRGIPCVFHHPKNARVDATLDIYDQDSMIWNDAHPLTPSARYDMALVLAVTSALLGMLADYNMRTRLNDRYFGMLDFFLRWRRLRQPRISHLAPLVQLNESVSVRMGDGVLWDGHALCATLRGLQKDGLLERHPAILVVSTTSIFAFEWWYGFKKHDRLMPECSLFSSRLHASRKLRCHNGIMHVYKDVVMHDATALPKWFRGLSATVDLYLMVVSSNKLNSIPFKRRGEWYKYKNEAVKAALAACDSIELRNSQPFALSIASGGARTALLGVETLRALRQKKIFPSVVGGSSGGAWAIALYGVLKRDQCIVDYLFDNVDSVVKDGLMYRTLMAALRAIEDDEMGETSLYVIGMLRRYRYNWRTLVNIVLFGSHMGISTWTSLNLPFRVVVAGTILSNSHTVG